MSLNNFEDWPPGRLEGDDLTVVKVHYRRREELSVGDIELGDIGRPLLVHAPGREPPLEEVRSNATDFALVETVLLGPDQRLQSHFYHQPLNGLVVDHLPTPADRRRHPAIAVPPLAFLEDRSDCRLQRRMPVAGRHPLFLIVESSARQARKRQQPFKRMERP